ncbi:hypothetical protein [Fluviicola taffensis]|uniref:Uncharacterized protein n=1 Tax=Fluviicola taffensis (strain DSM 16823 / NCIMB 13979 / RW262) TaxID=755732 RepID=F2IBZ1_FLUTR|nr:hypothetical protein [Fluviicola taffensis]AEA42219.1 hypothetical protein Fluta_0210 [Fluviicola taffensis DSM 16823]
MNRIKKFDLFLLERFPLLWHTKICYMLLYSIFLSVVFYFWGYFETTQGRINYQNIDYYFTSSFANYFQVIFFIIGITFWALSYFKKNAIKNYYPLQRFYFSKLFFQLVIIFWSLSWPYFTFNSGVKQKVKELVSLEELVKEIDTINLAHAFLPDGNDLYEIESLIQLKFPDVQIFELNSDDTTWNNSSNTIYESGSNFSKRIRYLPENYPNSTVTVENRKFQFLKTKEIFSADECHPNYITLVLKPLKYADLTTNELSDLKNYSSEVVSKSYFKVSSHSIFDSYKYRFSEHYYSDYYSTNGTQTLEMNEQFNQFLENASQKDISKLLHNYKGFLNKHEIRHYLEVDTILDYIFKYPEYTRLDNIVSSENWRMDKVFKQRKRLHSFEEYQRKRLFHPEDYQPAFFIQKAQLDSLYENVKIAYHAPINWMTLITSIALAIALSFLFILCSFSELITLLLTIPVGGLLLVINILILGFSSFGTNYNIELKVSSQVVVFMFLMYLLLILFYYSKKVHKRILNITFYLCFFLTIFLPHALLWIIDNLLRTEVFSSCGNLYTKHTLLFYWLTDPLFIILLPLASMLFFMKLIKPITSKAD